MQWLAGLSSWASESLSRLWNLIKAEPVAAQWALQCALNVAVDFGLSLTKAQHFSLITLSAAMIALATRQSVIPLSKSPTQ